MGTAIWFVRAGASEREAVWVHHTLAHLRHIRLSLRDRRFRTFYGSECADIIKREQRRLAEVRQAWQQRRCAS